MSNEGRSVRSSKFEVLGGKCQVRGEKGSKFEVPSAEFGEKEPAENELGTGE
jgi:hypothetical protein